MTTSALRAKTAQYRLPLAYLLSSFANSATLVAVMVQIGAASKSGWAVAAVLLAQAIPQILLAPVATPLLTKLGPNRVVAFGAGIQAIALLGTAVHPATFALVIMIAVRAVASILDSPALLTLAESASRTPGDEGESARAFARMDTARLLGSLLGPLIGGLLIQFTTITWVLVVNAVAVTLMGLVAISSPPAEASRRVTGSWWSQVREAPMLLWRSKSARRALVGLVASIVFTSIYSVAVVLYALNILELTPVLYAVLGQSFVVGRLLGSRAGARVRPDTAGRWLLAATLLMGVGLLVPGLIPSFYVAVIGFFFAGVANAVQVAAIRMVVVSSVPAETRGRSMSTMGSINQSAGVLGMLFASPVVGLVGAAGALVVAGAGTIGAALIMALRRKPLTEQASAQSTATQGHCE